MKRANSSAAAKRARNKLATRKKKPPTLSLVRSAISNGSQLLAGVDHRSGPMRRLRDLIGGYASDLGGDDILTEAERALVRRSAMLQLQCEMLEQKWALADCAASAADLQLYGRTANNLTRILKTLGLQRRSRDVTTDPLTYARQFDAKASEVAS